MKNTLTIILFIVFSGLSGLKAQKTQIYPSVASEMIFSFANIDNNGYDQGNVLRWSPVFNIQNMWNFDFGKHFGLYTGWAIRNVGFIYDPPGEANTHYKYRSYNFGVPAGIKLGHLRKLFIFGGYEIEFPFNYKEKMIVNEKKEKFNVWFSKRVEPVQHSVMIGIQFPYGADLKFKYYLTNFHNRDYTEVGLGGDIKPYENLKSNIFYISLCWNLFTNWKAYHDKDYRVYYD